MIREIAPLVVSLRLACLTLCVLTTAPVLAKPSSLLQYQNYFVGIHSGEAFPNSSLLKNGYTAGGEYGYRNDNYRASVQLDYTHNNFNLSPANYNMIDLMLNLFYDIGYDNPVVPFFGGGLGYYNAWQNQCWNSTNCNQLKTGSFIGYQGIGGLGFQIHYFRIDLRYRFLSFFGSNNFYENIGEVVISYFFHDNDSAGSN